MGEPRIIVGLCYIPRAMALTKPGLSSKIGCFGWLIGGSSCDVVWGSEAGKRSREARCPGQWRDNKRCGAIIWRDTRAFRLVFCLDFRSCPSHDLRGCQGHKMQSALGSDNMYMRYAGGFCSRTARRFYGVFATSMFRRLQFPNG